MMLFFIFAQNCVSSEKKSFSVLIKNNNATSGFNLVVEDYNYYFWAVLYDKNSYSPICSCFIGTTRNPLTVSEMPKPFDGNLPISEDYASEMAILETFSEADLNIEWDKKGESVVVYVKDHPYCLLNGRNQKGYAKAVKMNGSYGLAWDESIFRQIFGRHRSGEK